MKQFHPKYFHQKKYCEYNYMKGKRKGQICRVVINQGTLCSKHINLKSKETSSNVIKVKYHSGLKLIYDPKTNLVFKSDVDKMVIGSIIDDVFSSDYDIELCNKYGLRHCKKINKCNFLENLMENGIQDLDFNEQEFYKGLKEFFH